MFSNITKPLIQALLLFMILSFLTGIFYPLLVTCVGQLFFPWQANGSLVSIEGKIRGSLLIGQSFTDERYFWGRPSATRPFPYDAMVSSASNLAPTSEVFLKHIQDRIAVYQKNHNQVPIPIDLLTTSGSGLDPEISPLAALYQISRVAQARQLPLHEVEQLVKRSIIPRTWFILGEPRVNVFKLNLALDQLERAHGRATT